MTFRPWQAATHCTDGPEPGSMALMQAIIDQLGDVGAMNWGIYNCRNVRGAATTSTHGEGRALDVGFALEDPDGDRLRRVLCDKAWALGIQVVIYERRIWSASSPEGRHYDGEAPHYDHIHAEQTRVGAANLTLARARRILREGLEATSPNPRRQRVIDFTRVRELYRRAADGHPAPRPNVGVKWTAIALNRTFVNQRERARIDGRVDNTLLRLYRRYEAQRTAVAHPNVIPQLQALRQLGREDNLFTVRQ